MQLGMAAVLSIENPRSPGINAAPVGRRLLGRYWATSSSARIAWRLGTGGHDLQDQRLLAAVVVLRVQDAGQQVLEGRIDVKQDVGVAVCLMTHGDHQPGRLLALGLELQAGW